MLRYWKRFLLLASMALATALGLGGVAHAASYTFQELADGATFNSPDGNLHFDNFTISTPGAPNPDFYLSNYRVIIDPNIRNDGFRIVGPIDFPSHDVTLAFDVTATQGRMIDSAGLYFDALNFGSGAVARFQEDLYSGPGQIGLVANHTSVSFGNGGGASGFEIIDQFAFSPLKSLHIVKNWDIIGGASDDPSIVIDQHFTVVPEPSTASLMLLGLAGVSAVKLRSRKK
jgi:hypothetical protein